MSGGSTDPPRADDETLRRADALVSEADDRLRAAHDLYAQLIERLPDGPDRGAAVQRAWDAAKRLRSAPLYFSEAGQDRFLDEQVFRGKRGGVFVEIGGYDGMTGSNCFFFEAFRGWSGLIVEPVPENAARIYKWRQAHCVEAAVGPADGAGELIHVTGGYLQMSGLAETYDTGMLAAVRDNPDHRETSIEVAIRRLDGLLREHGLDRVDYCSLDVEGAERAILSEFPFAEFEIAAWSVENNTGENGVRAIMEANGYEMAATLGADEIYLPADRQKTG